MPGNTAYGSFGADLAGSYRVTLAKNEKTIDKEERDKRLEACHQRCANRTLKVLERNGSIFIKLGQHLVCCIQPESCISTDKMG